MKTDYAKKSNYIASGEIPAKKPRVRMQSYSSSLDHTRTIEPETSKPSPKKFLRWIVLIILIILIGLSLALFLLPSTLTSTPKSISKAPIKKINQKLKPKKINTTQTNQNKIKSKPQSKPKSKSKSFSKNNYPAKLPEKPQFDFYTLLPKQTVQTQNNLNPSNSLSPSNSQSLSQIQNSNKINKTNNKTFMVQVASYKTQKEVNQMVQKLSLLGFDPKTHSTSSGWYRIDLGPITTMRSGDVIRHKLQQAKIYGSMIRRVK